MQPSPFSRYSKFGPNFFVYVEKDKKAKISFRIYDVGKWGTNNCNMHIFQYPMK